MKTAQPVLQPSLSPGNSSSYLTGSSWEGSVLWPVQIMPPGTTECGSMVPVMSFSSKTCCLIQFSPCRWMEDHVQVSTLSNASRISSPTPPFSTTILIMRATRLRLTPPLGGLQTPLSVSLTARASAFAGAAPPVAVLRMSGVPAPVNLEGGSTILTAITASLFSAAGATLTATTASATASSSPLGSKRIFGPTEARRSVTGGFWPEA
jgi:hypothetical protein